jgi:glycosyltransferase involved in cell wall biosynthesis
MLSFVVPVLNEEESLNAFYKELKKTIKELEQDYEIIFVDDGSTDSSLDILKKFTKEDPKIKIFSFRRHLGKAEALTLGFIKAKGDYIITLDADLQDKPTEIHKLLLKAKDGIEVVSGWRKDRRDKSKMKIISRLFNTIMGRLFDLHLHDYNCGLKLYTRDAAKSLRLYGGLHRFIPLLAYEQGFTVGEVAIEHAPRAFGKSKYSFSKLWKDLPDMFTLIFLVKYGKRPLHFFGVIGGMLTLIGFIVLAYLAMLHFSGERIGNRPLLFFGMLLILTGFQIFFTGFLADLMIHISRTKESPDESHAHFPIKFSSES